VIDEPTSDPARPRQSGNGGGGNGNGSSWMVDGSLVKEAGTSDIYVIFGGAKFLIPSISELEALGCREQQVRTVPPGSLARVPLTPSFGTVLKERTAPDTYVMCSNRAIHAPTEDALTLLGLAGQVCVLPVGGLGQLSLYQLPSIAATPPSMVIGPNQNGSKPGTRWARTEVPGVLLPNGVNVVELYGWLREASQTGNQQDPDWHFGIEPDPAWLEHLGVDLTTFIKVGDILHMGVDRVGDWTAVAATPVMHIELDGWRDSVQVGRTKPQDWDVGPGQTGISDATFPWIPLDPTSSHDPRDLLDRHVGSYVHVSGSLVTDQPHSTLKGEQTDEWWHQFFGGDVHREELYATAARMWEGAAGTQDPNNPARWTEIHPPDLLRLEPAAEPRERNVWLTGICVVCAAPTLSPSGADNEITTALKPPGSRPAHKRLAIREFVGPETRFASIVEGNADRSGAQITLGRDAAVVHIKVHADAFDAPHGKFKAVYRLSWEHDPGPYEMRVRITPSTARAKQPTTATVDAEDSDTGQAIQGDVLINSAVVGRLGAPFTYSFTFATRRVWVLDAGLAQPTGGPRTPAMSAGGGHWEIVTEPVAVTVRAAGYIDATGAVTPEGGSGRS
jgi:hypothetical protein